MYRIDGNKESGKIAFEFGGKKCQLTFNASSSKNFTKLMAIRKVLEDLQTTVIGIKEDSMTQKDYEKLGNELVRACDETQRIVIDIVGRKQWMEVFGEEYSIDELEPLAFIVGSMVEQFSKASMKKTATELSKDEV